MSIILTARLQMIAELIPKCDCVADIGCDHGRLAVYILQNNIAKRVIAADISANSVAKAEKLAELCGVKERCYIRVGDGLQVMQPNEAQTVIVSGMGGAEIEKIVDCDYADYFIIQPQNNTPQVRERLTRDGFMIVDERLCQEGHRFYEIIKLKKGQQTLSKEECEFGPVLLKRNEDVLHRYIQRKIYLMEASLKEIEGKTTPKALGDKDMIETRLNMCREMMKCLY